MLLWIYIWFDASHDLIRGCEFNTWPKWNLLSCKILIYPDESRAFFFSYQPCFMIDLKLNRIHYWLLLLRFIESGEAKLFPKPTVCIKSDRRTGPGSVRDINSWCPVSRHWFFFLKEHEDRRDGGLMDRLLRIKKIYIHHCAQPWLAVTVSHVWVGASMSVSNNRYLCIYVARQLWPVFGWWISLVCLKGF